jgi:arylformamidase
MTYIDLTVPLNPDTPVYPGDPQVRIEPAGQVGRDGYLDHLITIPSHVGTHIDAPSHMFSDGRGLASYPLDRFMGRGVYVDARQGFDLAVVKRLGLQAGDIVLFHTGWIERYANATYFEDYPALPSDLARYLVGQKVSLIGLDMAGPDFPPFPIHHILLRGDVLIIENLTGLEQLAGRRFTVTALPIRLDIDGAPARVFATIAD